MKLNELLTECRDEYSDIDISGIAFDTNEIKKGCLFFCLNGSKTDGHLFVKKAQMLGASAICVEHIVDCDLPQVVVADTRKALSQASMRFYGIPSNKLKLIAITGTNGKTTTSYIVKSILEADGKKVGLIGTNEILYNDKSLCSSLTTPDPVEFNKILGEMVSSGVEYVVMEVSAHALELNKLYGIKFEVSAFTNLTQDHLDYFGDMQSYYTAKKRLFTAEYSKCSVLNMDDESGRKLASSCQIPIYSYGCNNPSDAFAINYRNSGKSAECVFNINDDIADITLHLSGKFNMYNSLCAGAVCHSLGIGIKSIATGIANVKSVAGRFNVIKTDKCDIIIDFAHTPDGLVNLLKSVSEIYKGRILTVFGCGGDRDKTKRAVMGQVVSEYSDYFVISSDNPRTENPLDIIADIKCGVDAKYCQNYVVEPDRVKAIGHCYLNAKNGDVIVIAGKGAEDYMDIGGQKLPYSDHNAVNDIVREYK